MIVSESDMVIREACEELRGIVALLEARIKSLDCDCTPLEQKQQKESSCGHQGQQPSKR